MTNPETTISNALAVRDKLRADRKLRAAAEDEIIPDAPGAGADPISAVANAAQALFHLITASIPSDELQRDRFKLRNPIIYAHIRARTYRQILRHLRFRWHEPVEAYVRLVAGAFTKDEQNYMVTLAQATLKRN